MIIRKALKEDLEAIIAMLADDVLGSQRENYREPIPEKYVKAFENIDKDSNQYLMVMEEEGEVIGTLQLTFIQYLTYQGGIRAQIEAVRVRKDRRGKGLGAKMITWAIDKAKQKGAHVLQFTTNKKRQQAIKFYENLGFEASHEGMKMYFEY